MARSWQPLVVAAILCAPGCVSTEPLEHELRQKESQIARLSQDAQTSRYNLEVCRRENDALRGQLEQPGRQPLLPEQAAAMFSLKEISLAARLTAGINTDNLPGDDALQVLLEPRDGHNDLIKSPGSTVFELYDLAEPEPQRRIGYWEFSLQDTAGRWQSTWLTQGYRFELPWQAGYPRHSDLTLHARLTTPDGRQFTATRQVRVELMPSQLPAEVPAKPTMAPLQPASPRGPAGPAVGGPVLPDASRPTTPAEPVIPPVPSAPAGPTIEAVPSPNLSQPKAPGSVGLWQPRSGTVTAGHSRQPASAIAGRRMQREAAPIYSEIEPADHADDMAARPRRYEGPAIGIPYPYHEPGRAHRF